MDSDFGKELQKMMTSDDSKNASIEAVKLMSIKDKDLAMKTEINEPMSFSVMGAMGSYLKTRNMKKSAGLISNILENFMVYAVSKKRMGRKEMIEVFKNMNRQEDEEKDFYKKWMNRQT